MTKTKRVLGLAALSALAALTFANAAHAEDADPQKIMKTVWKCMVTCLELDDKGESQKHPLEYTSCSTNNSEAENDAFDACKDAYPKVGAFPALPDAKCETTASPCQ